jgi:hypothetical protein
MNNFKKIKIAAVLCTAFITPIFADSTLSESDIATCKMYLDQIANHSVMSDAEKKQANAALTNCLENHPDICSAKPLSETTNCTHIKSKIELFGQAIETPTQTPLPVSAPKPLTTQTPAQKPAVTPIQNSAPTYTPPPTNTTPAPANNTKQPTNNKSQPEPYSYF